MASLCGSGEDGWLLTSHIVHVLQKITKTHDETLCFCLNSATAACHMKQIKQQRLGKVKRIVLVMNVGKLGGEKVFIGSDQRSGSHWTLAVINVATSLPTAKVLYCDSMAWNCPEGLATRLNDYTEFFNMSVSSKKKVASDLIHGVKPYKATRGEEFMNEKQEEHFRAILTAWRDELISETSRTVLHMQDEAANLPDPNDRASQETDRTLELRTRDRERKLIKKINESMDMIDSGDYGFCDTCGVDIGIRRLEARPTATQCIDCKSLSEIREKQLA